MKKRKRKEKVKRISKESNPVGKKQEAQTNLINRVLRKRRILAEITFYNGSVSHVILPMSQHKFKYRGSTYIVDEERRVWSNSKKMFLLRYHEGFAMPYQIELSVNKMKKGVEELEISTAFNPNVLTEILKFEYAKGVIQGAEVHAYIKKSFIIIIITLLIGALHLGLNAFKNGWI